MNTWIVGKDDATAEALDFATPAYDEEAKEYYVDFQSLKKSKG